MPARCCARTRPRSRSTRTSTRGCSTTRSPISARLARWWPATCAFAVSSAVPATVRNLEDYVAWVRRSPQTGAPMPRPAAGSVAHFLGFQLSEAGGLKLQHVGYRGSAPAMQDLIGGQIPAYFGFVADFLPYLQTGKVRILGRGGGEALASSCRACDLRGAGLRHRDPRRRDLRRVRASRHAGEATIKSLHESIVAGQQGPGPAHCLRAGGPGDLHLAPQDYARQIQRERESWGPVVRASGFRSEE
jgi:hypothetical protein